MAYMMHLDKSGSGMASRTACGRNILRTPLSTNWAGFTGERKEYRCENSSFAAFMSKKNKNEWVPVDDPDAWKKADDALIAAHKAKN